MKLTSTTYCQTLAKPNHLFIYQQTISIFITLCLINYYLFVEPKTEEVDIDDIDDDKGEIYMYTVYDIAVCSKYWSQQPISSVPKWFTEFPDQTMFNGET